MKAAKSFQGVLFDMDGLMIDTESIALTAFVKAMRDFGYVVPEAVFIDTIGLDGRESERLLSGRFGVGFPFEEISKRMQRYERRHIREHGIALKPGIRELLTFLERYSIKKGVGTSTMKEEALKKLASTGLKRYFDVIVGGDEVDRGKPQPDIYLRVAASLDVRPDCCYVLEDSEPGIGAAFGGGMKPIMIPDMKPPSETVAKLCHRIFPDLFAVIGFLRSVLEEGKEPNPNVETP